MEVSPKRRRLLDGIRVLDFTRFLAGPYLTRALGVMGADVIKIERPPHGDEQRGHPHFVQGQSGYFLQQNHDKRGLCMDLKRPEAQAVARDLTAVSDVVVENFRPGVMARMGLDYPILSGLNPRLIYCSVSSFGQDGPYAQRPGYGVIADALSGALHITGFPDQPPPLIRMPVADTLTGIHGVAAVCAALYGREKSGEGQYIDIALLDCMFALHEYAIQEFLLSGGEVEATRVGNGLPGSVPYGVFAGRDGCLVLGAPSDANWAQVCQAMGRPELVTDPRYASNAERSRHRDEVYRLVQDWVMGCPSIVDALGHLEAAGVPCARVQTIREVVNDPQIAARGMIVEMEHPIAGKVRLPNMPFHFSNADVSPRRPAPLLGQHNREILKDLLGYSEAKVASLEQAGVLHAKAAP